MEYNDLSLILMHMNYTHLRRPVGLATAEESDVWQHSDGIICYGNM